MTVHTYIVEYALAPLSIGVELPHATSAEYISTAPMYELYRFESGPVGPTGDRASISTDDGNMLREGADGRMFARMEWSGTPNW